LEVKNQEDFPEEFLKYYHTHLLCQKGSMEFIFNQEEFKCRAGEFVFWFSGSKVIDITFSKNFKASVLLVEKELLNDNIPDQGRSIDATLHSNRFPVLHLHDKDDRNRILQNFRLLHEKSIQTEHRFYEEVLKFQMRLFILEMWHVFSNDFEHRKRSIQTGSLYERYMHLLQEYCMKEREVQFYANQLHITAKYLNAVCKQNSGVTASEWIQRFAKERLEILLQNTDLNISEIADKMEFSSRSFFTRYVKKVLGLSPSEYRNRLD
tara:strand:+ start:321 stop:1115 length:795 start_codon:yes stop_codon:yes gene_type:complete